jgi:hypothetical protein
VPKWTIARGQGYPLQIAPAISRIFQPIARRIPNTLPAGSPSSFAIARPLRPRARSRFTASRFTVCGRPSFTPRRFAEAKPALIASTAAECLNSSIASQNVKKRFTRQFGRVDAARNNQNGLVRGKVSKHCHELRHTPAKPTQTGAQQNLDGNVLKVQQKGRSW